MELPILISSAQLIDTYIRWLAFSKQLPEKASRSLSFNSFIWAVASIFLYQFLFERFGINATTYKSVVMLGWLPYFLIFMRHTRFIQQVFVLGMGTILALLQHTICATILLVNFSGKSDLELIMLEALGYLLLFTISLPICRRYFVKLLPSVEFFEMRPIGIYVAVFPLVILSSHLIRLADGVFVHTWTERLSRIYLPLVFFFFHRYILNAVRNYYEMLRVERNKMRIGAQLTEIKEYNELIQANQQKITLMRHDLRHSYNIIGMMLDSGNISAALEHIRKQKVKLEQENE